MAMRPWPVTLSCGDVGLRPLRQGDARRWREVRRRNADWLRPWEATLPMEGLTTGDVIPTFGMMVRRLRRDARDGRTLPWALTYQGELVGQVMGFSQSHISRQLGQLQRAGLVTSERDGVRLLYRAEGQLVEDLCLLVQTRLRQRLEAQLESLAVP